MRVVGNLYKTLLCQSKQNQIRSEPPDHIINNTNNADNTMENTISLNIPTDKPKHVKNNSKKRPISQAFHAFR